MTRKPTYEELEQRVKELEKKVDSGLEKVKVSDINIEWNINQGKCTFEDLPVAMMWIDTTLAGLMSGVQAMVGTKRFGLALQSEGRKSVEEDWRVISQFSDFRDGFKTIANIAAVAGWGEWELVSFNENEHQCTFRIKNSWEGRYQKSLGVNWGSGILAGKMAGYSSKLFKTNCWAEQTKFIAGGDEYDEFVVKPSNRSVEDEIENLLLTDEATRADMAVALEKLHKEVLERKQAVEALRESEERYRSLFKNNHSAMLLVDPENANIVDANPAAICYYGWGYEELTTKKITEINIHTKEQVFQGMEKAKSEQRRQFIFRHRLSSGDIRDVEVYSGPIKLHGQKLLYSIIHDITDRIRAEEALRESESKFRNLFDLSPQAVALTEVKSGRLIDINNKFCELTKYSKEEILGLSTTELGFYNDADRSKFLKELQKSKEVNGLEMKFKAKDNSILHAQMFARIIQISGVSFILTIFHDMTEQKLLEAQLQQAQKMEAIGRLAGGIAHDFNNILGIIIGNTELAFDDVPKWNSAYFNLEEIKTASLRAKDIVRNLLSFSRKTDRELKPIEIVPVIKNALKFLRPTIPTTIDIRQNILAAKEIILADQTQINQLLMNLCINAYHAMEQTGGVIEITMESIILDKESVKRYRELNEGYYFKLTVNDTGPGLAPEIINQIFDPYFTTKDVGKGSGIGLALVHSIVKNHNGVISVASEVGKGTTFTVLFPLAEGIPEIETHKTEELPFGGETILFVDDENSIANMNRKMLERLGYKVEATTSPIEALDLFRSKPDQFDLVITDLTMPEMTGDKLVKEILKIQPEMPIIICTGFKDKMDSNKAREIGAAGYLEKPHEKRSLARMVRKVLDRK